MKQGAIERVKSGAITAHIYENKTADGASFYSYVLTRSFKKDDRWHQSRSFTRWDLSQVLAATVGADEWIRERERTEARRRKALKAAEEAGA